MCDQHNCRKGSEVITIICAAIIVIVLVGLGVGFAKVIIDGFELSKETPCQSCND